LSDEPDTPDEPRPAEGPPSHDVAGDEGSDGTTQWLKGLADPSERWGQGSGESAAPMRAPDLPERAHRRASAMTWLIVAVALIAAGAALVATSYYADGSAGEDSGPADGSASVATTSGAGLPSAEDSAAFVPGGSGGVPATSTADPSIVRPTEPARAGAALETLQAAPEKTITLLSLPEGVSSASYAVTFQPFGWGPGGEGGGRLVVRILEAEPVGEAPPDVPDLAGSNVSLYADQKMAGVVTGGGTYSGVVAVRSQADVGILVLQEAESGQ
jgi:hypothetical protein